MSPLCLVSALAPDPSHYRSPGLAPRMSPESSQPRAAPSSSPSPSSVVKISLFRKQVTPSTLRAGAELLQGLWRLILCQHLQGQVITVGDEAGTAPDCLIQQQHIPRNKSKGSYSP